MKDWRKYSVIFLENAIDFYNKIKTIKSKKIIVNICNDFAFITLKEYNFSNA